MYGDLQDQMNYGKIFQWFITTVYPKPKFNHMQKFFIRFALSFQKQPPEVIYKKGVLKKFAKFTGKHLCQSLFFNKFTDLRRATLLKKRLWHRYFPENFAKFLRTLFLQPPLRDCF